MKPILHRARRNNKFIFYVKNYLKLLVPGSWLRRRREHILGSIHNYDAEHITSRVNYYNQLTDPFTVNENAAGCFDLPFFKSTIYTLDLLGVMRYFPQSYRFQYEYGDVIDVFEQPTLVKSRPLSEKNSNSVLLKLNQVRHFNFITDPWKYHDKKPLLVWRGKAYQPHRKQAMATLFGHPLCDVGQTNKTVKNSEWQCPEMSIYDQLGYKYILCIEGNDVASNLKWAMSSNSVCFMTKPKYETWFMEGQLVAGKHYVELKSDYSDLEEKISHYNQHPSQALEIVSHAHDYVAQFKNQKRERLISLLVLEKYFQLSGQSKQSASPEL